MYRELRITLLFLAFLGIASAAITASCPEPQFPSYEGPSVETVQRIVEEHLIPGLVDLVENLGMASVHATVVYDDSVLFQKGFGLRDPSDPNSGPLQSDDLVYLGSITKSFTSLMMLMLRDQGLVHLDDPVSSLLPDFKLRELLAQAAARGPAEQRRPVQLQEMAAHESGLWRQLGCPDCNTTGAVAIADGLPPLWVPGLHALYSNAATGILGMALGRAARRAFGLDYYEFQRRRIALPLNMTSTTFDYEAVKTRVPPAFFLLEDGSYFSYPHGGAGAERSYLDPSGSLLSTPDDVARYMQFLVGAGGSALLAASTLHEWLRPRSLHAYDGSGYGLGLETHIGERTRRVLVGKDGAGGGYISQLVTIPALRLGVFVVSNTATQGTVLNNLALDVCDRMGAAVDGFLVARYPRTPPVRPELYVGVYEMQFLPGLAPMRANVTADAGGQLYVEYSGFFLMPDAFRARLYIDAAAAAFRGVLPSPVPLCDFAGARDFVYFDDETVPGRLRGRHARVLRVPSQTWVFAYVA